jgi:hypothetical protein
MLEDFESHLDSAKKRYVLLNIIHTFAAVTAM